MAERPDPVFAGRARLFEILRSEDIEPARKKKPRKAEGNVRSFEAHRRALQRNEAPPPQTADIAARKAGKTPATPLAPPPKPPEPLAELAARDEFDFEAIGDMNLIRLYLDHDLYRLL